MTTYVEHPNDAKDCRQALEALRNGVPNRTAVRMLGCTQPQAQRHFTELLARASDRDNPPDTALGLLVSGGFGDGKSHLLTHFEHQALEEGFVCSKVAISKETPLYDLAKVFKSAVENGRMPDRNGRLIEELGQSLRPHSGDYAKFYQWANDAAAANIITPMLPASLMVHERSNDLELRSEIESFWAGDRIKVSRVKDGLRQVGQLQNFPFRAPKASDLPAQRLRFFTELTRAAGYRGWVVLLDEIELTGQYSLMQRGRAYAEIARWQGQTAEQPCPGLVTVGAVTDDFVSVVISIDGKKDIDNVVPKLEQSKHADVAPHAATGMRLLETQTIPLDQLTDENIRQAVAIIRRIYSTAYGWNAPELPERERGAGHLNRMRYNVRAAINEWDLIRLYPGAQPETESEEYRTTYEENPDLEPSPQSDEDAVNDGPPADAPEDDSPF